MDDGADGYARLAHAAFERAMAEAHPHVLKWEEPGDRTRDAWRASAGAVVEASRSGGAPGGSTSASPRDR